MTDLRSMARGRINALMVVANAARSFVMVSCSYDGTRCASGMHSVECDWWKAYEALARAVDDCPLTQTIEAMAMRDDREHGSVDDEPEESEPMSENVITKSEIDSIREWLATWGEPGRPSWADAEGMTVPTTKADVLRLVNLCDVLLFLLRRRPLECECALPMLEDGSPGCEHERWRRDVAAVLSEVDV